MSRVASPDAASPGNLAVGTSSQDGLEQEIGKIDQAEAAAIFANDLPASEKFWAEDFTVNAPNNQIIVMGEETVKPKGKAPFAGQTVRRRFTNIWMKRDGWQLTARQATIISKE